MINKARKYRFLHNAKCPYCRQTNLTYITLFTYEDFSEKEEERWEYFCEKKMDSTLPLNPCEHLALYTAAFKWVSNEPYINEKWQPQILKLAENLELESTCSLSNTSKLGKFMDEYLEENCYDLELKEIVTKLFTEHKHKVITIETDWENSPASDFCADPFHIFIYIKPQTP